MVQVPHPTVIVQVPHPTVIVHQKSVLESEAQEKKRGCTNKCSRIVEVPFDLSLLQYMGIYIAKLTTFLREWLHILRASGRNLMHKRLNVPVQGFHLPLSKQLTSLWGFRVKWRSGLCFENGESLSHLFILFCVVWL